MACVVGLPILGNKSGRDSKSPEDFDDIFVRLEIKKYIHARIFVRVQNTKIQTKLITYGLDI